MNVYLAFGSFHVRIRFRAMVGKNEHENCHVEKEQMCESCQVRHDNSQAELNERE